MLTHLVIADHFQHIRCQGYLCCPNSLACLSSLHRSNPLRCCNLVMELPHSHHLENWESQGYRLAWSTDQCVVCMLNYLPLVKAAFGYWNRLKFQSYQWLSGLQSRIVFTSIVDFSSHSHFCVCIFQFPIGWTPYLHNTTGICTVCILSDRNVQCKLLMSTLHEVLLTVSYLHKITKP